MKHSSRLIGLLFSLCLTEGAAFGQNVPPQQRVKFIVKNADTDSPVVSVRVAVTYAGVREDSGVTSPRGEAFLRISTDTAQRDDLRLLIDGARERGKPLVIFQPADAQLQRIAANATVTVLLLPAGSPKLAGNAQIEAMQRRLSLLSSLQRQRTQQLAEIKGLQAQVSAQRQAVDEGLEEWAKTNGLDPEYAKARVRSWAQNIQSQPGASAEQKALAAFALKDYKTAAEDFRESVDTQMAAFTADRQQQQEQNLHALQKLLKTTNQRAVALQLDYRYHEATAAFKSTSDYIAGQQSQAPQNKALSALRMQALSDAAFATMEEGKIAAKGQSLPLLESAINDLRKVALEDQSDGNPTARATAENNLGIALIEEGERVGGDRRIALLEEAEKAFRNALKVRRDADLSPEWAETENNLGIALMDEGEHIRGDEAIALFKESAQAFREVLKTSVRLPLQWARTQANLGSVLFDEGEHTEGDGAVGLFEDAAKAFKSALGIYTKPGLHSERERYEIQSNLGNALSDEADRVPGDKGIVLLEQAATAFQSALEVCDKPELQYDCAVVQQGLGVALTSQGERVTGDTAITLLKQAVQALNKALEIYTPAGMPQPWAEVQNDLGVALKDEAERTTGPETPTLLKQSMQAYQNALGIWKKTTDPYYYALVMRNLSGVYRKQGDVTAAEQALNEAQSVSPQ